jgi:inosine/xanthosine triphosphatase
VTVAPAGPAVLGSASPAKRRAAREALHQAFGPAAPEVIARAVPSRVADQPVGDRQTRRGAYQRARAALRLAGPHGLGLGIEGGVVEEGRELWAFGWVAVLGCDPDAPRRLIRGSARSAAFVLPKEVARRVRAGEELRETIDAALGASGSKLGRGAVGVLTEGRIDRAELYRPAVVLALLPWLRPELYARR